MKKLIVVISFCCITALLTAQQTPNLSQYYLNSYSYNSAVAGSEENVRAAMANRYQWIGVRDAPHFVVLGVHGPVRNSNVGVGVSLYSDIVGPSRKTGFKASYAYHIKLFPSLKMSLGLGAGLLQYTIDGSKIYVEDQTDDVINGIRSALAPDLDFGIYLYQENFYLSLSGNQLLNQTINFSESDIDYTGKLAPHLYAIIGNRFPIKEKFKIETSVFLKYVAPITPSIQLSVRGIYQDKLWLGGGYKISKGFVASVGAIINESFMIGYSYDIVTSAIQTYQSGSHELILSFKFKKDK